MSKKLAWTLFQYVLAFGLLAVVIWLNWNPGKDDGLSYVWHNRILTGDLNFVYLLLALVILTLSLAITLVRWYILVRTVGFDFTLRDAFRLGIIGFFFNAFLPGSVGGDLIKAAALAREKSDRRTRAVATVIMDRVIALWALIWFVAISGCIFWSVGGLTETAQLIVKIAAGIVGVTLTIWLAMGLLSDEQSERFAQWLSKAPKVGTSLGELWRAGWTYRRRQKSVALVMLISWVGHIGFVSAFYFGALVFTNDPASIPKYHEHFLLVPIGLVIQALPLFPGGAGIGELGFGTLYTWFGALLRYGVLGSLVMRILTWVIGFGGYFVYLSARSQFVDDEQEAEQTSGTEKAIAV